MGDGQLVFLDIVEDLQTALEIDVATSVKLNCRVVRLSRRIPKLFSNCITCLVAMAREMFSSLAAAAKLPAFATLVKTFMLASLSMTLLSVCNFFYRNNL